MVGDAAPLAAVGLEGILRVHLYLFCSGALELLVHERHAGAPLVAARQLFGPEPSLRGDAAPLHLCHWWLPQPFARSLSHLLHRKSV